MARIRLTGHSTSISNIVLFGYHHLSDGAKQTYLILESFDWPDENGLSKGKVWPTVATIAEARGKSHDAINRHLNELEAAGLIEIESGQERAKPNCYYLLEPSQEERDKYEQRYVKEVIHNTNEPVDNDQEATHKCVTRQRTNASLGNAQMRHKELKLRNKNKELETSNHSTRIAHDTCTREDKEPYPINEDNQELETNGYARTQYQQTESEQDENYNYQSQDQQDYQDTDREKETPPFAAKPPLDDEGLASPPPTSLRDVIAWQKRQKEKAKLPAHQPTSPTVTPPVLAKPVEIKPDQRPTKPPAQAIVYIARLMNDFSNELKDEQHTASNSSQAITLFKQSGLSQEQFVKLLYKAKEKTRYTAMAGQAKAGNKGAYFFKVVRDLLSQGKSEVRERRAVC